MTAIRWLSGIILFSCVSACGGSTNEPAGSGGSGALQPGCSTAPRCGTCQACYDTCTCEGKSTDACVAQCATNTGGSGGGSGGTPSGGGSGGSVASGGSAGAVSTDTYTIKTTPRDVGPGDEAFFCQNFANPFGKDVDVIQSESFMTPGSHHMFVFYAPGATDGPVEDCSGLEYEKTLHTAQTPQQLIKYPAGVGKYVAASDGLRVLAHYLNTGKTTISAELTIQFKVVPAGSVAMQAASVFFNNFDVYVPPMSPGSATKTCSIPYDAQLLFVVSHMHQFGVKFDAKTNDGQVVYQGTAWNDPVPTVFDPPMQIKAGSSITYTCDYNNTSAQALVFGESAKTNEMCILSGTYFPAPNGKSITCF